MYFISTLSEVTAFTSTSVMVRAMKSSSPVWAAKVMRKGSSMRTATGAGESSVMYRSVTSSMPSTFSRPPMRSRPVSTGDAKPHSIPRTAGEPSGSMSMALPLSAAWQKPSSTRQDTVCAVRVSASPEVV